MYPEMDISTKEMWWWYIDNLLSYEKNWLSMQEGTQVIIMADVITLDPYAY